MARVFKPTYTTKTGERVTVPSYYAEWWGADGKQKRAKVGPDIEEAHEFLRMVMIRERRAKLGLPPDPAANPDTVKPLSALAEVYIEILAARGASIDYRKLVKDYLTRTFRECKWTTWRDITADSLLLFLGRRRDVQGNGPATLNSYLRTAKGFGNWLAERIDSKNPLRGLKRSREAVDRRRSKRIPTDLEFFALVAAAEKGKRRGRQVLTGRDRAMLYQVAAFTGLRASELASLTPERFALEAQPPTVTVDAMHAKNRRLEPVPIPAGFVEKLRTWLSTRPRRKPVWPGEWASKRGQVHWIATDLARAGVAEFDDQGRRVTFHSFRRFYITRLIRAGAKIHEVRRMARHKDVKTTLDHYTDENLADLAKLADLMDTGAKAEPPIEPPHILKFA